jgi:tetratricopeptide (TPR) repeat protein
MGDIEAAVDAADAALSLFQRLLGPDHQRTILVQSNLAAMQSTSGDHEAAARQHRALLEHGRRLFGPSHPAVARSLNMLASELLFLGRQDEAGPLLEEALNIQRAPGARPEDRMVSLRLLGDVRAATGRPHDALAAYREALDILSRTVGREHSDYAVVTSRLAAAHESLGDVDVAARSYREAAQLAVRAFPPGHATMVEIRLLLVRFLQRSGSSEAAAAELDAIEGALEAAGVPAAGPVWQRVHRARDADG